jgi:hypothetical protein
MFFAAIVLIVSSALFFFYLQSTCERVLRRQFGREYFQSIAQVCRLEFPSLRLAMARRDSPLDYASVCEKLRADFVVLSYLRDTALKDTAHLDGHPCLGERLLDTYFNGILFALPLLRVAGAGERAIRKLTAILEYSTNMAGERFCSTPSSPKP